MSIAGSRARSNWTQCDEATEVTANTESKAGVVRSYSLCSLWLTLLLFHFAHHPKQVSAKHLQDVVALVAAVEKFLRDVGVVRHVIELHWRGADAVVIAS